ncbi:hypothetical protein C1H46_009361 [Malus baccata]|uniref:Uncharacterized protein n=1 Tax=Malus baccata TaxID=106549 RepID=A0A540N223_MALBA|nr:hypothetical protein C1H46_009361 [Malus baccata]
MLRWQIAIEKDIHRTKPLFEIGISTWQSRANNPIKNLWESRCQKKFGADGSIGGIIGGGDSGTEAVVGRDVASPSSPGVRVWGKRRWVLDAKATTRDRIAKKERRSNMIEL